MRKEDEQAIKRTIALLKTKCQENKLCDGCSLNTIIEEDNHIHHGCVLDVPPAFLNAEDIINNL